MSHEPQVDFEEALEVPYRARPEKPLARRLRTALNAARGNVQIRQRLKRIAEDPDQLARVRAELGGSHATVRDLLAIADLPA